MINWELETNRLKAQQQSEFNSKIEANRQSVLERERLIQDEIKNNYENCILPGLKLLDSFHIKETLTKIRDQVWKRGDIFKRPNNFEEYKNRSEYTFCSYPTNINKTVSEERQNYNFSYDHGGKNLPTPGDKSTEEVFSIKRDFNESKEAKYVLFVPKILVFMGEENGYGVDDYKPARIEETSVSLTISSEGKHIFINGKSINTEDKKQTEVQSWINEILIEDCIKRRDYSQIDPEILKRPELYKEYLDRNQPTKKRTFLDKLFG